MIEGDLPGRAQLLVKYFMSVYFLLILEGQMKLYVVSSGVSGCRRGLITFAAGGVEFDP